ncbi:hypothetical protein E5F90_09465 [Acinetobacter baumannii]|nr:hypothetical protein E5F90_09465 [Acinetobacter baumannii]
MKLQGSNILGQEQIDLLTTRGLNFVWFPKQLETIYRFQYQNGAAYEFRYRAPIILILYSVHDKFHRTLILSGFCFLKIAKISLNSSFFPKPIKR